MTRKAPHQPVQRPRPRSVWQIVLTMAVLALFMIFRGHEAIKTISLTFTAVILEAMPFMMIGAVISGLVEVFISRDALLKIIPKRRWLGISLGAGLGCILPVCECAIIPVVRRLMRKGMPMGAGIAFLLGGPIVNPVVAASTAAAYGFNWSVVAVRLAAGYSVAVLAGWLIDRLTVGSPLLNEEENPDCQGGTCDCHGDESGNFIEKIQNAMRHAAIDFYDVARYFVVGAFLAAILQTLASRQEVTAWMSLSPAANIGVMMLLALLLNLCSEADAFVAASFNGMVPFSGQMAFMVLGPMLDLKLLATYFSVFRRPVIVKLSVLVFLLVLLLMLAIDMVLR